MEIIFTACHSLFCQDYKLKGATSIWMFPIYGLAALIYPLYPLLKGFPAWVRSIIYSIGFFFFEFLSGTILKRNGICPWDYSDAKTNIKGVIRLDYAPVWMLAGLIFERILVTKSITTNKHN